MDFESKLALSIFLADFRTNTCHCGGEIKTNDSTDNDRDGGTNYQDNSIGKMHKVQERRCATPYSFENRDWLPYLIDSHA